MARQLQRIYQTAWLSEIIGTLTDYKNKPKPGTDIRDDWFKKRDSITCNQISESCL